MRRRRGFVLLTVLVLAVLYFGFMNLLLIDAAEATRSAQRYRSRVVADVMAENGYELAARNIALGPGAEVKETQKSGTIEARLQRPAEGVFDVVSTASTAGVYPVVSTVKVHGRILEGGGVDIVTIEHSAARAVPAD